MVGYIKRTYPKTQLIVVGFSLGGNIVCKFLGESRANQERVLCCVSVCQGYSALRWVLVPLFPYLRSYIIRHVLTPALLHFLAQNKAIMIEPHSHVVI